MWALGVGSPEFGKSCEWANSAVTTSRVLALKRGLQVVRVTKSAPGVFFKTVVSFGETTWVRTAL